MITRFLWESVNDLQQTLRKRGSELVVRLGEPEKVIIDLVKSYQQDGDRVLGVYMQKEVSILPARLRCCSHTIARH